MNDEASQADQPPTKEPEKPPQSEAKKQAYEPLPTGKLSEAAERERRQHDD